ncbi:hypothetical protein L6304_06210, partial [bacterium]|nr:hypothetical protein [bacterium]MCG2676744.1 hypothetical protein [bacterium]
MRKRFIYFSLLIVLLIYLVNIGQGEEKQYPLKVTIKSDKEVYEVSEPINIELKITNIQDKKITICTRLIGAFLFDIVDSKGQKIWSHIRYRLRPT